MAESNQNTLIVGGGIVGATLALKLARQRMPVTLIDARQSLINADWQLRLSQRDARVYALSPASIELLKEVGAWQLIETSGRKADYTQMQVWQQDGKGELKFGDEIVPELLGSMVEPVVIEHALQQCLNAPDLSKYLTVITGRKVVALDWLGSNLGYEVRLEPKNNCNGKNETSENLTGKLLIGADGRGSIVRRETGIQIDTLNYKQTAICCAIKTEQPHRATARQLMLPSGTLALLPMADIKQGCETNLQTQFKPNPELQLQHWQSVVWTLPTNKAQELLQINSQDPDFIRRSLASATQYALGDIVQLESLASFPLKAQQATHYVQNNLALVGDAAHGVHPLAGQGLNLGMLDIKTLINVLIKDFERSGNKLWGELATLRKYERLRRPHNSMMMHSFSTINWFFTSEFSTLRPIQQIRSEGMYQVGKIKPLMRFLTKKASGV